MPCYIGRFMLVGLCSLLAYVCHGEEGRYVSLSIGVNGQSGPNSVIIPFRNVGGLVLLSGIVDGREGHFILDTGANGLVLNSRYFDGTRLADQRQGVGLDGTVGVVAEKVQDSLLLDELHFYNVRAQIVDLREIEKRKKERLLGLIGYQILKTFEVQINYRLSFVTFSRVDGRGNLLTPLPHTAEKMDSFEIVMRTHLPVIEVEVGGVRKRMGIDSGAEVNLLNTRKNKQILSKHFKIVRKMKVSGLGGQRIEGLVGRLYSLALKKRYRCGSLATAVLNLSNLEAMYSTNLDGILGYPFLAPWVFSINYRKRLLYIHPFTQMRP